jgi:murein DD-endopeptidase MepM/ murein hydrolase activator NlpD
LSEVRLGFASATLDSNFFDDAQEAGLSESLAQKLVEIFEWDIDFARHVGPGDSFAVVYEENYFQGQKIAEGRILAAEWVVRGRPYRAFAQRDDRGYTQYYAADGLSVRNLFLRNPVRYTRISSRYTESANRFHPILKTWTAHRGIDYAAPTGTPVRATAAGRILSLGPDGGYGNCVVLTHGGTYTTLYAHLSRFERGIRAGSAVEQGQIIGYVGATGLATGPHLHYEFQINGGHRDPMNFKSPGGAQVTLALREEFDHNRNAWGARLDQISPRSLAARAE